MTWEEAALGVDVSHWQPEVDWAALRAGGVTFAVLKATQGTGLRDTCFIPAPGSARAAGLRVGRLSLVRPHPPGHPPGRSLPAHRSAASRWTSWRLTWNSTGRRGASGNSAT